MPLHQRGNPADLEQSLNKTTENKYAMTSHCETSGILKITFAQSHRTVQSIISPPTKKKGLEQAAFWPEVNLV